MLREENKHQASQIERLNNIVATFYEETGLSGKCFRNNQSKIFLKRYLEYQDIRIADDIRV